MSRLKDKVLLLTGGGGDIGSEIALACAEQGAKVCIGDLNEEAGKKTVEALKAKGYTARFSKVDTTNEQNVKQWIDDTASALGSIDVLVNNAALFVFGNVETVTSEDWDKAFSVNVKGYAFCSKYAIPHMRKKHSGSIVNVGSISSFIAQPNFVPYNSTKGAVLQLTRCVALDVGVDGIRVNAVCPGTIYPTIAVKRAHAGQTEQEIFEHACSGQFLKRFGNPRDVANAVVFLASDESSFVTGTSIMVDGGRTAH
eukprot:TRINITY_DN2436_c0_g1_i1.p1 TRINITY_DN2436_c0_g1~~TRINITY_DN2436_c0_g1_i1.p1  ORF type:complete len:255 (-),score=40.30 TRINITY_DN2436_c0_g1_i1:83-847(-)